tara:strand:+ start:772 stop:1002 length:231 start_codon:yes stop_codon:yes gene_type:complete
MKIAQIKFYHKRFREELGDHYIYIENFNEMIDVIDTLLENEFKLFVQVQKIKDYEKRIIDDKKSKNKESLEYICIK